MKEREKGKQKCELRVCRILTKTAANVTREEKEGLGRLHYA